MAKRIRFIKFEDKVEEDVVIDCSEGYKKNSFNPKGIYSEEIFGDYYSDDNDISKRGWIDFNYPVINPVLYLMMKQNKIIDKEEEKEIITVIEQLKTTPEEFILSKRNAKNAQAVDFILQNKELILINKFPVFSHKLRPITVIGSNTLIYDKINNLFQLLIEYNNNIGDDVEKDFDIGTFVLGMQQNAVLIIENIIEKLKGKKGIIRKEIFAARLNFTARNVIIPLVGHKIDDVALPYITALELYKYQIINILSRVKKINYNQALRIWMKAQTHIDPEIYEIMNMLLKNTKGGLKILLNRNPKVGVVSVMV